MEDGVRNYLRQFEMKQICSLLKLHDDKQFLIYDINIIKALIFLKEDSLVFHKTATFIETVKIEIISFQK